MNDKIFAFTFIIIAFFVLGFTISRAVFRSPAPAKDTASVSSASPQMEIPEENLAQNELSPANDEGGNTATTTPQAQAASSTEVVEDVKTPTVTIKNTPTGWLNVREGPGLTYGQIKRINPGESYNLLEEKFGWYKIKLSDTQDGWIASQYAVKSD